MEVCGRNSWRQKKTEMIYCNITLWLYYKWYMYAQSTCQKPTDMTHTARFKFNLHRWLLIFFRSVGCGWFRHPCFLYRQFATYHLLTVGGLDTHMRNKSVYSSDCVWTHVYAVSSTPWWSCSVYVPFLVLSVTIATACGNSTWLYGCFKHPRSTGEDKLHFASVTKSMGVWNTHSRLI